MLSDNAINNRRDDLLKRAPFVERLTDEILNHKIEGDKSFTVGIYGSWGSGKTSILNMVANDIIEKTERNNQPIIIRFNPWNYTNTNQLLEQFFQTISVAIKASVYNEKLYSVGNMLAKYSSAIMLVQLFSPTALILAPLTGLFGSIGVHLMERATKKNNIMKLKENIVKCLQDQKQKLLVIIDDLDRLNNDQIRLMFQLVNSIADFPYMLYLLAFDRIIVSRALEKEQNCDGEEYLEKIIQVMFPVPDVNRQIIEDLFFDHLNELLKLSANPIFDKSYWSEVSPFILEQIRTVRDIKRLINAFKSQYLTVSSEFNFVDLLAIVVMQLFHPKMIIWIKHNQQLLQGNDLMFSFLHGKAKNDYIDVIKSILDKLYPQNPETFLSFISKMFPWFGINVLNNFYGSHPTRSSLERMRRVASPLYFSQYFTMETNPLNISHPTIIDSITNMNESQLHEYIHRLHQRNQINDYVRMLFSYIEDVPNDRLIIIFNLLLWLLPLQNSDDKNQHSFEPTVRYYLGHSALKLLEKMNPEYRFQFLCEKINQATLETLPMLISVIWQLREGKAANLNLSSEEIETILENTQTKTVELSKTKGFIESTNLNILVSYWDQYDPTGFNEFLKKKTKRASNIAYFIAAFIYFSYGEKTTYHYSHRYDNSILSEEKAYKSIKRYLSGKPSETLPSKIQQRCIAFILIYEKQEEVTSEMILKELKNRSDQSEKLMDQE